MKCGERILTVDHDKKRRYMIYIERVLTTCQEYKHMVLTRGFGKYKILILTMGHKEYQYQGLSA